MNNIIKYFNAPLFESRKSLFAVRYQSDLEYKLLKRFEAEKKIKSYHQPILSALVKAKSEEFFINVDFWLEFVSGKIELVFLATQFKFPDEAKVQLLLNDNSPLNHLNLGFIVVTKNKLRRIQCIDLKLTGNNEHSDTTFFVNFDWVN